MVSVLYLGKHHPVTGTDNPTALDARRELLADHPSLMEAATLYCDGQALRDTFVLADVPASAKLELRVMPSTAPSSVAMVKRERNDGGHDEAVAERDGGRRRVGRRVGGGSDAAASPPPSVQLPIVVGNVTWWLGPSAPADKSHQWCVYVRGVYNEDLSDVVASVTFTLHDTFPNHIRVVHRAPFECTEHGWGEFLVGISIKLVDVPQAVDVTHLLQFSLRPKPQHCVPPSGKLYAREEMSPYTLSPVPCVFECYDELVVEHPTALLQSRVIGLQQRNLEQHRAGGGARASGGVTCWDDIRKHGPRYLTGFAGAAPPAPPSDDLTVLSGIRQQLTHAVAQLSKDIGPSMLASLRVN